MKRNAFSIAAAGLLTFSGLGFSQERTQERVPVQPQRPGVRRHELPPAPEGREQLQGPRDRFRQLPPESQERLKERFERFRQLPDEQKERLRHRLNDLSEKRQRIQGRRGDGAEPRDLRERLERFRDHGPRVQSDGADPDQGRDRFMQEIKAHILERMKLSGKFTNEEIRKFASLSPQEAMRFLNHWKSQHGQQDGRPQRQDGRPPHRPGAEGQAPPERQKQLPPPRPPQKRGGEEGRKGGERERV